MKKNLIQTHQSSQRMITRSQKLKSKKKNKCFEGVNIVDIQDEGHSNEPLLALDYTKE